MTFKVRAFSGALSLLALGLALSACGNLTNGNAQLPNVAVTPLASVGKPTFAVGTARLQDGTLGLNVVAFLRQSSGATAYLLDSPSITGPSGFVVPNNAGTAGNSDAGGSVINSSAQGSSTVTTFGTYGGLFGGGFGPFNTINGASNFYPGNVSSGGPSPTFPTPFYSIAASGTPQASVYLIIGPPAVPAFNNGTFPTNFAGYLSGFSAFEAAPVSGQYTLTVKVPAVNVSSVTITAQATLNAGTALAAIAAPTFTEDGAKDGGGTVGATAPAGAAETLFFINSNGAYYTVGPVKGTGAISGTLPAGSIGTGVAYSVTAVSFDYPDFEATPPGSKAQTPTVTGAAGQADVSISPATTGTY
jgi:hypothetical protein